MPFSFCVCLCVFLWFFFNNYQYACKLRYHINMIINIVNKTIFFYYFLQNILRTKEDLIIDIQATDCFVLVGDRWRTREKCSVISCMSRNRNVLLVVLFLFFFFFFCFSLSYSSSSSSNFCSFFFSLFLLLFLFPLLRKTQVNTNSFSFLHWREKISLD